MNKTGEEIEDQWNYENRRNLCNFKPYSAQVVCCCLKMEKLDYIQMLPIYILLQ